MGGHIARWPGYNVPLLQIGSGEAAVHLAGAAVFALVGFRKVTALWIVLVFATVVMASASSRGAMLAFLLPVIFASLMLGKVRELATVLMAWLAIFSAS